MSFFSKTEIKDLRNNHERIIRIAVSNVPINPTIAITTSNKIHLFNESGDKHQYELSRSITPTCIEWHPTNPILAIGWDNGKNFLTQEESLFGMRTLRRPKRKENLMPIQSCWSSLAPLAIEWSLVTSLALLECGEESTCLQFTKKNGQSRTVSFRRSLCRALREISAICSYLQVVLAQFVSPTIWTCVLMCAEWAAQSRLWCSTKRRAQR